MEGKSAKAPSVTQLVWAGEAAPEGLQLWEGLQPHTGRGELAPAPAVPRPWHVPGLLALVLALAWLEERSQTRAGNAALYVTFLLGSFNPGQDPCLVPCSHSHACGKGTGGTKQALGDKPECPVPSAPASRWNMTLNL